MEKRERHRSYQRARSWKRRPTRFITARFSVDGMNATRRVEVLRKVDEGMLKWVPEDRILTELLGLAKRNGWIA